MVVGGLVGDYPFEGNADDHSGFENHGVISGAQPTTDRFGAGENAYSFDGVDDHIQVPAHASLNFQDAISLNFWMKIGEFFPREAFPLSHGSWQNRWKVSIIPEKNLRWTVNTDAGIFDLDSQNQLERAKLYNVTVTYGEGMAKIYLDGELNNDRAWQGKMKQTSFDLTIAQMLPGNTQYNFKGELDDIKIFNYVLSPDTIRQLAEINSAVAAPLAMDFPQATQLFPGYPNPFKNEVNIPFSISKSGLYKVEVFNARGQAVATLFDAKQRAGFITISWEGKDRSGQNIPSGFYFIHLSKNGIIRNKKILLLH